MKRLLLVIVMSFYASMAIAEAVQMKEGHPDFYYVKKGDTLWDISNVFLNNPWFWPEIWHINPQISNPHLIYPGDKLALVNGQLMVVERAPVKLTQKMTARVRTSPDVNAIPAIPLDKISAFLSKTRVVTNAEIDAAPYVIAGDQQRIISGAGDKLYARGNFDDGEKAFGVYRPGITYSNPETGEVLGIEAQNIGAVNLLTLNGDIATMAVNSSNEEIRVKDRLLPNEERKVTAVFHPKAPTEEVEGLILHVEGGVNQVGSLDVVAISLGERDAMQDGDILAIYQKGDVVKDKIRDELIQLPDERAGMLIVFRVFDKMALGLVVSADRPLKVGDKVTNP